MFCEECQKNKANVHLTKIINGKKVSKNLCKTCSNKYEGSWNPWENDFTFSNLIGSILGDNTSPLEWDESNELSCPKCGLSYTKLIDLGRVGCAECYKTFDGYLDTLLKRIHGNTRHTGKLPRRTAGDLRLSRELEKSKFLLRESIRKEEFEKAAELRDKIKEIERNISGED